MAEKPVVNSQVTDEVEESPEKPGGDADIEAGRVVSHEEAKRRWGLCSPSSSRG